MASYYLNEAVISLPERRFVDKTIHGLEAKLPGDKTLGVLVTRRPLESGQSLRALVDENIELNKRRLGSFTVIDEKEALAGGLPAILLRTSWRREGRDLYQRQAHVVVGAQLLVFAVSGPLDERRACDDTFGIMVETIVWRTGGARQ
jgi:hypothetical protein